MIQPHIVILKHTQSLVILQLQNTNFYIQRIKMYQSLLRFIHVVFTKMYSLYQFVTLFLTDPHNSCLYQLFSLFSNHERLLSVVFPQVTPLSFPPFYYLMLYSYCAGSQKQQCSLQTHLLNRGSSPAEVPRKKALNLTHLTSMQKIKEKTFCLQRPTSPTSGLSMLQASVLDNQENLICILLSASAPSIQ